MNETTEAPDITTEPEDGKAGDTRADDPAARLTEMLTLAANLERLSDIVHDPDEYEEGFDRPTEQAFKFAWKVLAEAAACSRNFEAQSIPAPVGDGGLTLDFGTEERRIRLVVPPDPAQAYMYCRGLGERRIYPASGEDLAMLLNRLSMR